MSKSIVILGGSYAGLHIAHYLLKQKIADTKVILVSKVSLPCKKSGAQRTVKPQIITIVINTKLEMLIRTIEQPLLLERRLSPGHRAGPAQR